MSAAEDQPHGFFNRPSWKLRIHSRIDESLTSLGYPAEAEESDRT